MKIILSNTIGIPIYEQIKEQIKTAIYTNKINEDEQLPSIRQLAKELKISVITTTRAYNDLESEGFITSVAGKGFYVMPKNKELIKEQAYKAIEEHYLEIQKIVNNSGISEKELEEIINSIKESELNDK